MRGVFSLENLILLISSYFMAINILGDERTDQIKDRRFKVLVTDSQSFSSGNQLVWFYLAGNFRQFNIS